VPRGEVKDNLVEGLSDARFEDKKTVYTARYTARVGYMFSPYVAVEGNYYNLGDYSFTGTESGVALSGTAKASAWGAAVVGTVPVADMFEAYGRLGYSRAEGKVSLSALGASDSCKSHKNAAFYGVGVAPRLPAQMCASGLPCGMMRSEAAIAMAESRNVM
jgi:hypothetical protein